MERTEPTLVPEWLRCTGNGAGGGTSIHHTGVSSSAHSTRTRYFRSNSDKDTPHYLDRSPSFNSRRSPSSNGSAKHPYSSFSRSRWDKNRDKEKPASGDVWEIDSSDPLSSILTSNRIERSGLRRSQSLISRKPGETLNRKVEDSHISGAGGSNISVNQKYVFEKDFPSLGTEEKQGVTGIKRVLSPGLGSAVQSLTIGSSGFLSGDKWTSALIDVPPVLANNGLGHSSLPQSSVTVSNSSSGVSNSASLNMAEALSQPAARINANTQQPDKSQRLEELAIKQSRQLIPMTPSMPKPLVSSSSDKSKQPKIGVRTNDISTASKGVHTQLHPTHNHATKSCPGQIKPESSSTSHTGRFLVLKPGREIITSGTKDGFSSDTNGRVINDSQTAISPSTPTTVASIRSSNPMVSALETNTAALAISPRSNVDKKSAQSTLAQSRSEFFKLMRRKASSGASTSHSGSSSSSSGLPTIAETSAENFKEDVRPHVLENGDRYKDDVEEKKSFCDVGDNNGLSDNGSLYPDKEEAAFLRSLGWDENGGEDEGLTEEEINAFYQEYMNRRPSMGLSQISQPRCSTSISGLPNSDSESEPKA